MNPLHDVKLKDEFVEKSPILSKRLNSSDKYRRPWGTARVKHNILGFNFHLYRKPSSYRMVMKRDLFWRDKENIPPFGVGITVAKFEYRIKRLCPKQYVFREWLEDVQYRIKRIPRDINSWYITNILDRINPYNVIKIKTLPRTYCDHNIKLEHGMFQVLDDFMADAPDKIHDYEDGDYWKVWWEEAKFLHNWWKNRETWEAEWQVKLDSAYAKPKLDIDELTRLEAEQAAELDDKLIRLIKIRQGLWT